VWSTDTGWPDATPPNQSGLRQRIVQAVLPARRPELAAFFRRYLAVGAAGAVRSFAGKV
jgi:hypothetical protein